MPAPDLIVEQRGGLTLAALVADRRLIDLAVDRAGEPRRYQSIWLAKLDRIVPHVGTFAALGAGSGLLREDAAKSGDTLIVQAKSLRGEGKADIMTTDIAFPGRHFVYLPRAAGIAISRRADKSHARVEELTTAFKQAAIKGGILMRNGALTLPVELALQEVEALCTEWREIERRAAGAAPGDLLREGPEAARRLQVDHPEYELTPSQGTLDLMGIDGDLRWLLQREIPLPRGGSVIIEETSALTAIDVNAGTRPPGDIDREALATIADHIRLRNLSGLIVIDFAAAASKKTGSDTLLEAVRRALADDPARPRIAGLTPSGLVEITRPARDLPLALRLGGPT